MIFIDTGIWFEAEVGSGDASQATHALLQQHESELVTSSPVLAELWNLIAVRRSPHRATRACIDVAASVDLLHIEQQDHDRALGVLATWRDQTFSYADALSFVLAEREGIEVVGSFDDHFRVYRYGPDRGNAFRVLP